MSMRISGLLLYLAAFLVYPFLPATRDSGLAFTIVCGLHVLLGLALLPVLAGGMRRRTLWILALIFLPRLVCLPMHPWLSDDAWRYMWDGGLVLDGKNVYLYAPADPALEHLRGEVFDFVDYRDVKTIYPPLAQLGFAAAVLMAQPFGGGAFAQFVCLKVLLVGTEIFALLLLLRMLRHRRSAHAPPSALGYYLFSPLPVIEFAGQGHLDAWLLPLLAVLLGIVFAARGIQHIGKQKNAFKAGAVIGAAALVKVLPIVLLALWWRCIRGVKQRAALLAGCLICLLLFAVPFFSEVQAIDNLRETAAYYSNVLEFNGVPLYVLKALLDFVEAPDYWEWAPNLLSALRMLLVAVLLLRLKVRGRDELVRAMFWVLCAALLISSKVHTWYFAPLLLLNVMIGFRWLPFFAGFSMLTYAIYAVSPPAEAYVLEYIAWGAGFAAVLWELSLNKRPSFQPSA